MRPTISRHKFSVRNSGCDYRAGNLFSMPVWTMASKSATTVPRRASSLGASAVKRLCRALAICGAVLAVGVPSAHATVLIRDDAGGPLGGYMQRYASIRDSGEDVVVDGECLSACTLVLALVPRQRICLTSNAVFGFHAAVAQQEWQYPGAGSAARARCGSSIRSLCAN